MTGPSRNAPCPCGSGLKFKRCHGAPGALAGSAPSAAPGADRARAVQALDHRLVERMLRFDRQRYGKTWYDAMLDTYTEFGASRLQEAEEQFAMPWAFFGYRAAPSEPTYAERFREAKGRHLERDMRELLDAQIAAWHSLWLVESVDHGVGMTVRDQLSHDERYVHERLATTSLDAGAVLLARVVDSGGISFLAATHPLMSPELNADALIQRARRRCRVRTRPASPESLRDADFQRWLIGEWRELAEALKRPPIIQNSDGDPLEPIVDHLAFTSNVRTQVLERLKHLDGANEPDEIDDETEIVITRAGSVAHTPSDNTIIGRLVVGADRLRIETNSERRADRLRAEVLNMTRPLVWHRLRETSSIEGLLEAAKESRDADAALPARPAMTPEQQAAMRDWKARHYRAWVDDALPALNGITPRAAMRTARGREKVEMLVRQIERGEASLPEGERFDVAVLRRELGLDE